MAQTNRNLAAKFNKSKAQKVDFAKAEYSKAAYQHKVSDGLLLTGAIAARCDVAAVGGKDIRRIGMVATERTSVITVGERTSSVTHKAERAQTMRQYLRAMF